MPKNVVLIDDNAFYKCAKLKCFEIPYNANLQIGLNVFSLNMLQSISIPSNFTGIKQLLCKNLIYLDKIELIPTNNPNITTIKINSY